MTELPRLLNEFEPVAGAIKSSVEDFEVEELPLYPHDGVGTHTFFQIEKRGLSTPAAIQEVARTLGVRRIDLGYAGMKDARAVTRQWFSIEHVPPERVLALPPGRVRVIQATRHGNKLKRGHLRGNRFIIRVRGAEVVERAADIRAALEQLARRGVPNYFGVQRFGARGDSWQIGEAMLSNDLDRAIDYLLGRPAPSDSPAVRRARELYEAGQFLEAADAWPQPFHEERRALRALAAARGKKKRAFFALDPRIREFYLSAYQSHLFNQCVARRIPRGLERLLLGDLAWLHASGAVFRVEDLEREQPRADRFEISPTGPLYGRRMTAPTGEPAEIEAQILRDNGVDEAQAENFHERLTGGRRPLRFAAAGVGLSVGADSRGSFLELAFELPAGCYATVLLRELFVDPDLASADDDD